VQHSPWKNMEFVAHEQMMKQRAKKQRSQPINRRMSTIRSQSTVKKAVLANTSGFAQFAST